MTLKELITDYNTKQTKSICMIPETEVDLEKIKQVLIHPLRALTFIVKRHIIRLKQKV